MKRTHDVLGTLGVLACVLLATTMPAGCGESNTGGPRGVGGATQGVGGATRFGGSGGASQGTGGATTTSGGGGAKGTGGSGTGGLTAGGNSGSATGGNRGTGGGGGSGGIGGTGGKATGGTTSSGGNATGGATGLDGGTPDAPLAKCSDVTTQAECDARSDCHSVFVDPGTCGCAASGCCARFQNCADGDMADCGGPAACTMATPHCESPYVVAYRGSCFEGCVKESDCAPPACPQAPPANGASCGSVSQTCLYEDCAGVGRTVATCTYRAWQVTTGACASVYCEPNPDSPYALSCAAGKVCVVTTTTGGGAPIVTPMCVDHTCGTGPITSQCVPSLNGTCTASYSLGGAIFRCQIVADCGDAACA
jgi:hypothetical protein